MENIELYAVDCLLHSLPVNEVPTGISEFCPELIAVMPVFSNLKDAHAFSQDKYPIRKITMLVGFTEVEALLNKPISE